MTDAVQIALIMSTPAMGALVLSFYNGVIARRVEKHSAETRAAITLLEKNTNSIKDALVISTRKEGFNEGQKDEKQRAADIKAAVAESHVGLPSAISRQENDSK